MEKENLRIEYIDVLKGFAIFCVIWGHSLQYLKGIYDVFHNPIFELIYSFHMPLFFMISGFFFSSSLKLNYKPFLSKKSFQLLLPCIVWAVLFYLMKCSISIFSGNEHFFTNWYEELKLILFPSRWIWFLKELFLSYSIVYVAMKFIKKEWLACLLSIGFVLVAPYCGIQRVLLPVFWAGIYLNSNYQIVSNYTKLVLIASGIIFAICLVFGDGNYTMYVTNFPNLLRMNKINFNFIDLYIAVFRLLIGLCGSLFCFMLFAQFYKKNKFTTLVEKVGVNTLAIYLL